MKSSQMSLALSVIPSVEVAPMQAKISALSAQETLIVSPNIVNSLEIALVKVATTTTLQLMIVKFVMSAV